MERDVLQVFASTYVAESDIPTEDKLMLIDYIRECDEFGVMYLLSTGEMLGENEYLDEKACGILSEQYEVSLAPLLELTRKEKLAAKAEKAKKYVKDLPGKAKGTAAATGAGIASQARKQVQYMRPSRIKSDVGLAVRGFRKSAEKQKELSKMQVGARSIGKGKRIAKSGARAKARAIGSTIRAARGVGGYAVILATATAAGYGAYKRYFSAASKACAGKSGADRSACVDRFKKQAKMAQVKELQKGMAKCGNNPGCRSKLQGKISKAKSNM